MKVKEGNLVDAYKHQLKTATLCTILSYAPRVDVAILSQHHHVVVSTGNLAHRSLLKKLQKNWLQNLHAQLALDSNAAIIVRPEHVHLVFICKRGRGIFDGFTDPVFFFQLHL